VTPTSLRTIGLDRRGLSSYIASRVWGGVRLEVGSVGCVVGGIVSGIGLIVCWGVGHKIGWSIGSNVSGGVTRLHYFVFTSSLFSHRVEGTLATMSLERVLRSASRIGTCRRSTVFGTSFLDLSSCNTDIVLEVPDH
jgi:hypothetical protein